MFTLLALIVFLIYSLVVKSPSVEGMLAYLIFMVFLLFVDVAWLLGEMLRKIAKRLDTLLKEIEEVRCSS